MDTSGQLAAADTSIEKKTQQELQATAGMPATARQQQIRPPQLMSFSANSRKKSVEKKNTSPSRLCWMIYILKFFSV